MSEQKVSLTRVRLPEALVCYAYVWQPRPPQKPTDTPKFSVTLLWPKGTDMAPSKLAARAAAVKKWGEKLPGNLKSPFRDGDVERSDDPVFKGMMFITARSKEKPGVVGRNPNIPITNEMDFYSGCKAIVTVNAFGYDNSGNKGVSFALANIQKVSDGDRLTGRKPPEEDFEDLGNDPNGGMAGTSSLNDDFLS